MAVASELELLHHPPAAATTLLLSLGAMTRPRQLAGLGIGIVLTWLLALEPREEAGPLAAAPAG